MNVQRTLAAGRYRVVTSILSIIVFFLPVLIPAGPV